MTRPRYYGEDSPFGAWLRQQPELESVRFGITATDRDFTIHRYRPWVDAVGTRRVQLMMALEVKTRNKPPDPYQQQTKFFEHQRLNVFGDLRCSLDRDTKTVWHFGYYYLVLPSLVPGLVQSWWRFNDVGKLEETPITGDELMQVLRFDLRPDTLEPLDLRRHHKTQVVMTREQTPLGFEFDKPVIKRS